MPVIKKVLLFIFILLIICLSVVYFFIPAKISLSETGLVNCIPKNVNDCLLNTQQLHRWWPAESADRSRQDSFLIYKGYHYELVNSFSNGAEIEISKGERKIRTKIILIPFGKDSTAVEWQALLQSGYNPFKRIGNYFEAGDLKNDMQQLLDSL